MGHLLDLVSAVRTHDLKKFYIIAESWTPVEREAIAHFLEQTAFHLREVNRRRNAAEPCAFCRCLTHLGEHLQGNRLTYKIENEGPPEAFTEARQAIRWHRARPVSGDIEFEGE